MLNNGNICVSDIGLITNDRATVVISDLQCGIEYTIVAEGMLNGAIVGPGSFHGNVTAGPCPSEYICSYVHRCCNL